MDKKIQEIVEKAVARIKKVTDSLPEGELKYKEALATLAKIKHDDTAVGGHKYYADIFYDVLDVVGIEYEDKSLDFAIYDIGYLLNKRHKIYAEEVSLVTSVESEEVYTYLIGISNPPREDE